MIALVFKTSRLLQAIHKLLHSPKHFTSKFSAQRCCKHLSHLTGCNLCRCPQQRCSKNNTHDHCGCAGVLQLLAGSEVANNNPVTRPAALVQNKLAINRCCSKAEQLPLLGR